MTFLRRFGIDTYMLLLLATMVAGAVLPARGVTADILGVITWAAVALLFFLYGVRLNASEIWSGLTNWRLQGMSFAATFAFFPLVGLALAAIFRPLLGDELAVGLLFLSVLPSTINSSIAFTGLAGGNVSGAICAASLSNLIGVALTPALAAIVLQQGGGEVTGGAVVKIALQILLPFVLGQVFRRWLSAFVLRHKVLTTTVDRGAILLIVYSAFSAGTVAGLWTIIPPMTLVLLFAVVCLFLVITMTAVAQTGRLARLAEPDRLALFFCGSTKSLASGLPIAAAIFPAAAIGTAILPIMMFHMTQLLVCAVISQRIASRAAAAA